MAKTLLSFTVLSAVGLNSQILVIYRLFPVKIENPDQTVFVLLAREFTHLSKFFPFRVEVSLSRQAKRNPQNLILFVKMTKKNMEILLVTLTYKF